MNTTPHVFTPDAQGDCIECPLPREHPRHLAPPSLPETPYAGTSGWSGSQTSRERAETEDREDVTSERQRTVLTLLDHAERHGLTWKEIAEYEDWHHGQASGVLSTLHKTGHVARLAEVRRERCAVYVLPGYVNGRPTAEQGRAAADPAVVKRTEWRVDGAVTLDGAEAKRYLNAGRKVEERTVIETPWAVVER